MKTLLRGFAVWCGVMVACVALGQPFPHVIWERNGAGDSSRYGGRIIVLGDQNGDGFADFAVDAWGWGGPGQVNEARTDFFYGGNPPATTPYRTFRGNQDTLYYGCLGIGDINGDTYKDWLTINGGSESVSILLRFYLGGPTADTLPAMSLVLPIWHDNVGPLGDFNGDGYDDFYVYHSVTDSLFVFFGSATPDAVPDWTPTRPTEDPRQVLPQSSGDLNGDGYEDFVSLGQTHMNIFWGGAQPATMPGLVLPGWWSDAQIPGDLNGDGHEDVATGLEIRWGGNTISTQPDVLLTSPCQGPAGGSESGVGDINGDGWGDLVLSEEFCDNDYFGAAMLYLGSPWMTSAPAYTFWGFDPPADIIGHRVAAGLGDVNGDGVNDFALGGFNDTNQGFRGRAVIIAGDAGLHAAADEPVILQPSSLSLAVYPNPFNSVTTISFVVPHAGGVSVKVFDVTGRLVKTLWDGRMEAGEQAVVFEGKGLSSGVYVVRVQAGDAVRVEKMVLLK